MSGLKKYVMQAVCVVLCCCLFSGCVLGCGKEAENNRMNGNDIDGTGSDLAEKIDSDGKKNNLNESNSGGNKQEENSAKGNFGNVNSADDSAGNGSVTDQGVLNADVKFELLENYKERNILSIYTIENENEQYSNLFLNENNEIVRYTYADEADGFHIWKYTLKEDVNKIEKSVTEKEAAEESVFWVCKNGAAWIREPVLWLEGIREKISYGGLVIFRGEDRNDYAWYMGDDQKAHLVKRTGDSHAEIPISDWRITDTDHALVAVLANGQVVSADAGRECFLYNPEDGSLITSFKSGFYESICVSENIIYITTNDGASVQRYDAQKQEFLPIIGADFDNSVRIACQDDNVYVCTPTGIFAAGKNGENFQKIMEAGTFHFAKENGILLKFFVIGDAFYVVYGEDKVSIKKYFPAGAEEEISNSLTVYSLRSNDLILDMISEFQNAYPDIELIYETGEGAEGSLTSSDHIRALNARILAEDGPDVLLLDGLPVESYINKGILEDLSPVFGSMKEELLDNILEVYSMEDQIYMLPMRVVIPVFMTSGQEPEVFSTLEALVEYSEAEGGVMNMGYSYANILQILYYNYTPDILSADQTVNKEEVKKFLSLARRFCVSEEVTDMAPWSYPYVRGYNQTALLFAEGDMKLGFLIVNGWVELSDGPAAAKEKGGELAENKGIFFPNALLGMNSLSKKKEIASSFIRFAFSYEVQKRDVWDSGYPIHEKLLDEYAKEDFSHITGGNGKMFLRYFNAAESDWMVQVVKRACKPVVVEENIWEIFVDVSEDYLKGKKALEETVEELAGRLELYFYEQ